MATTIKVKQNTTNNTAGSLVHGELGVTQDYLWYGDDGGTAIRLARYDELGEDLPLSYSGTTLDFYSASTGATFNIGRNVNERLEIDITDTNAYITYIQDETGTESHNVIFAISSSNTGERMFKFSNEVRFEANATLLDNDILNFGTGDDIEFYFSGSEFYTDINNGEDWSIRDGNSSNATRFRFDVDNGDFYSSGGLRYQTDTDIRIDWTSTGANFYNAAGTEVGGWDATGINAGTSTIRGGAKFTYSSGILTIDVT